MKLIQVMFRDVYKKEFTNGPHTYNCKFNNIKADDLCLVETRYGISLGQVYKTDVKLINEKDRALLKDVVEVCETTFRKPYEMSDRLCKYSGKNNLGVCYNERSQYYEQDCVKCKDYEVKDE